MRAIIDFDVLRYEVGYAAEYAWKKKTGDEQSLPPWDFVRDMLNQRIGYLKGATRSEFATLYMSEGPSFREKIAVTKPYKGTRSGDKPWHYKNITVYATDILGAKIVTELEADDAMAIDHIQSCDDTVLISRDKDLRQVPGQFFSWELGRQPEYSVVVHPAGHLHFDPEKNKLTGNGYFFFASQVLTGDTVDNIPGLPQYGPKKAYELLSAAFEEGPTSPLTTVTEPMQRAEEVLQREYTQVYGSEAEERLTEQAQLCWIIRRLNSEGTNEPELWKEGLYV